MKKEELDKSRKGKQVLPYVNQTIRNGIKYLILLLTYKNPLTKWPLKSVPNLVPMVDHCNLQHSTTSIRKIMFLGVIASIIDYWD